MLSLASIASKIFGSSNDRMLKSFRPKVAEINALESEIEKLSDADLLEHPADGIDLSLALRRIGHVLVVDVKAVCELPSRRIGGDTRLADTAVLCGARLKKRWVLGKHVLPPIVVQLLLTEFI